MKGWKNIFLLVIVLISQKAVADNVWHTSVVKEVYPHANNRFVITFQEDSPSCPGSGDPKYYYVEVGKNGVTNEGIKMLFSGALSAAISGTPISIVFDNSTNKCYINRFKMKF